MPYDAAMDSLSQTGVNTLLTQAFALHRQGQLEEAARIYDHVLRHKPNHAECKHLLGILRAQQKQHEIAVRLLEESLALDPNNAKAWANLGSTWLASSNPFAAVAALDRALELDPQYPVARLRLAQALHQAGQSYAALESCQQSLQQQPRWSEAWVTFAGILADLCQFSLAVQMLDRALSLHPADPSLQQKRLETISQQTDHRRWLEQQLGPVGARDPDALRELLHAHQERQQLLEAVRVGHTLVARNLKDTHAYMSLGQLWSTLQQPLSAIECYDRVISLDSKHLQARFLCGLALYGLSKHEEALEQFDLALLNHPTHIDCLYLKASTLLKLKRYGESIETFERVESLAPDHPQLKGELLSAKLSTADWSTLAERRQDVLHAIQSGQPSSQPFFILHLTDNAELQQQAARNWAEFISQTLPPARPIAQVKCQSSSSRIRVGYFSMDIRHHPVAYLTAGLFEAHDRELFEVHLFDYGPWVNDEMQIRIRGSVEHYHRIEQTPTPAVVNLARALKLDIAVDLAGYTAHARPELFQQRLAPIQISYLGYPGTSGAPWMDYIIGDPWMIPPSLKRGYSENIIELPFFQINDDKRPISKRVFSRQELGIPEDAIVYCCFNSNQKINPEIFSCWMLILSAVPDAILFLLGQDEIFQERLRHTAQISGVDPSRLVFAGWLPADEYLARFRIADLFLDTFPFNAGTTASDALWAGLPVLTCSGQAYASRMAGSLLLNLGLPELVTESQDTYQRIAIELGHDRHRLMALRQRLNENRLDSSAFDTVRMTRWIEQAFTLVSIRAKAGLPSTFVRVADHEARPGKL